VPVLPNSMCSSGTGRGGTRVREILHRIELPLPECSRGEVAEILLQWAPTDQFRSETHLARTLIPLRSSQSGCGTLPASPA